MVAEIADRGAGEIDARERIVVIVRSCFADAVIIGARQHPAETRGHPHSAGAGDQVAAELCVSLRFPAVDSCLAPSDPATALGNRSIAGAAVTSATPLISLSAMKSESL